MARVMDDDDMAEPISFCARPAQGVSMTQGEMTPPVQPRERVRDNCFPVEPFACCPGIVLVLLPITCQRIHDGTHGVIVIGTMSGIVLVFLAVSLLPLFGTVGCDWSDNWCWTTKWLWAPGAVVFAVPIVMYCMRIMQNYDEQLQTKRKQVREQKESLVKCYQGALNDMEGLLSKSAESASGLAERSFESKRRDFLRFLDRSKSRFATLKGDRAVLDQFRRFCINWLRVFEECSIDPIGHPKTVVTNAELERCCSIEEVADVCIERLRATEVRFISMQRDEDAKMIQRKQGTLRRMTVAPGSDALNALALVGNEKPPSSARARVRDVGPSRPDPLQTPSPDELARKRKLWIVFGGNFGCRYQKARSEDGYPKELAFGCGRLFMLSKQHVNLMLQFVTGWALIGFQIAEIFIGPSALDPEEPSNYSMAMLVSLSLTQLCVFILLLKFEDIDTIQQLEREVKELKMQSAAVETQREKMGEFWGNAQQLTDLWLYRTVPRLDLYKELHSQLEDGDKEDLLTNMAGANGMLEDLETNLGSLQAWRTDGDLILDHKKVFGRTINQLCQETEFDKILLKLEDVANGSVMARLKALPPAPSPR